MKVTPEQTIKYILWHQDTQMMECTICKETDYVVEGNIFKKIIKMKKFHKQHIPCVEEVLKKELKVLEF